MEKRLVLSGKSIRVGVFLVLTIAPFWALQGKERQDSPYHREMEAVEISNPPKVDGKLNDPVWQSVSFQSNFLQREPKEGEPATERTEIAIIYDRKNLYIGVRCFDSHPENIRATEMRRDAMLWQDDYFSVIFDTYRDSRNAFFFETNPLGARRDGTISDEGRIQNSNWDGVWKCKTSRDNKGWYIEMAIPWQTLRFKEGENTSWGANFVRHIQWKNEDDYWRLISRDAGWFGRYRMSESGIIYGFKNLKMGGKFEFKPYTTGGIQHDEFTSFRTETTTDAGLDVKINLTSTLTADLTYNTDFAQVEADQERVNLTRFSLYFPEKREFFLEGAEIFTFGQAGRNFRSPTAGALQLFYSRTIGLQNRQLVPILAGARVNGRIGKYTVGLLNMQTQAATITDDDEEIPVPSTNFSVIRLKRDLFKRSSAGFMFLNKEDINHRFNRSLGFDSNFPVTDDLTLFAAGAGTITSDDVESKTDNLAAHMGFSYQTDLWELSSSYLDIQENFNPEMGFIRRTDIRRTEGRISYQPRPKRWPSIRQFEFQLNGEYQTDHQNLLLNRKLGFEITSRFENTARLSLEVSREYEYLDYDWEVREGFLIPEAGYFSNNLRVSFNTSRSKDISARFSIEHGDYFTGTRTSGRGSINIVALTKLKGEFQMNYNHVSLPQGTFNTATASARIIYAFNPDLYVKAFLQLYDDKLMNDGKTVYSGNIIMRYHYRPGSDFYLVLNQVNHRGHGVDILKNRTILAKFTYFLRR